MSSDFVSWNSTLNSFSLNGSKFVPVGFNAYWMGLLDYSYPSHAQIEEMFIIAQNMKATVIRSHTLGITTGQSNALFPNTGQKIHGKAWETIDYAFMMAKKYNIKLIVPLTDAYNYPNGNYGDYCKPYGIDKTQFWTDPRVRKDFKTAIFDWLNHKNIYTNVLIKNSPELAMIELGNELGNIRYDTGSTSIPTKEWLQDISSYIKSIDSHHLIMDPTDEALGKCGDFSIQTLDVYSSHYYSQDYSRIDYGSSNAAKVHKPYIIGEFSSRFGQDWFNELEKRPNVQGALVWNFFPHQNGYKNGAPIQHNDGFTLHYPEDTAECLLLTNYFRKMQNLPILNSLP